MLAQLDNNNNNNLFSSYVIHKSYVGCFRTIVKRVEELGHTIAIIDFLP